MGARSWRVLSRVDQQQVRGHVGHALDQLCQRVPLQYSPTDITTELKSVTKQYKALVSQSTDLTPDQKAQKMHLKTRIKELKAAKTSEAQNVQASQVTTTVRQGTGLSLVEAVNPVDGKRWVDLILEVVNGRACRRHTSGKGGMNQ